MGWIAAACCVAIVAWYMRERSRRRTHAMMGGIHLDRTVPYTAEFELYHNAFSLCSKKVRMCMAELGLPYVSHHVDLVETGSYENIGRRYLAVSPAALVPVLIHNGHPIYESHDIITYAAEHSPTPDLLVPQDPQVRAVMQRWIDQSSLTGDDPVKDLDSTAGNCIPGLTVPMFAAMIADIPTRHIIEGLLFHRIKSRPLFFLILKAAGLRRLPKLAPAVRLINASWRRMGLHLDDLERHLASTGGPWITGGQFTLADVSWTVIFERLREADRIDALQHARWPQVCEYWARLQGRPSYRTAMLDLQHPLVLRGTARIAELKGAHPGFRSVLYSNS